MKYYFCSGVVEFCNRKLHESKSLKLSPKPGLGEIFGSQAKMRFEICLTGTGSVLVRGRMLGEVL